MPPKVGGGAKMMAKPKGGAAKAGAGGKPAAKGKPSPFGGAPQAGTGFKRAGPGLKTMGARSMAKPGGGFTKTVSKTVDVRKPAVLVRNHISYDSSKHVSSHKPTGYHEVNSNLHVVEDYRRNSGNAHGTSVEAQSAISGHRSLASNVVHDTHKSRTTLMAPAGIKRAVSACNLASGSKFSKSMTNVFLTSGGDSHHMHGNSGNHGNSSHGNTHGNTHGNANHVKQAGLEHVLTGQNNLLGTGHGYSNDMRGSFRDVRDLGHHDGNHPGNNGNSSHGNSSHGNSHHVPEISFTGPQAGPEYHQHRDKKLLGEKLVQNQTKMKKDGFMKSFDDLLSRVSRDGGGGGGKGDKQRLVRDSGEVNQMHCSKNMAENEKSPRGGDGSNPLPGTDVYDYDDNRRESLQNTLGGTNITSATPVGLSSHMDPKALAVAAGIGATTFAPMGNTDDGTAERQYSYETEVQRERSMSDGQEYYGEEAPVEEERFVSDLMEATTIGENHHKLQYTTSEPYNHGTGQYTPLLEKDPLELAVQQPRVVQYQKQPEIRFPLTKQDANLACQLNLGDINNYSLQRGNNDGTFCYSILLIVGVLLMGVGIVLYILQALLGYKALESIIGGIMFLTGVVVLICSMMGWKRRASHNEKKMIQV